MKVQYFLFTLMVAALGIAFNRTSHSQTVHKNKNPTLLIILTSEYFQEIIGYFGFKTHFFFGGRMNKSQHF